MNSSGSYNSYRRNKSTLLFDALRSQARVQNSSLQILIFFLRFPPIPTGDGQGWGAQQKVCLCERVSGCGSVCVCLCVHVSKGKTGKVHVCLCTGREAGRT